MGRAQIHGYGKKLGWRKIKLPSYSYLKEWTDKPPDSDLFNDPQGHRNPPLPPERSRSYTVRRASVGAYGFDPQSATLPEPSPVPITKKNYIPSPNALLRGDYIFIGEGTIQNPNTGDMRISYTAVKAGTDVTMFGKLKGDSIEPYSDDKKGRLAARDKICLREVRHTICSVPLAQRKKSKVQELPAQVLHSAGLRPPGTRPNGYGSIAARESRRKDRMIV